jgi:hypothetical protein
MQCMHSVSFGKTDMVRIKNNLAMAVLLCNIPYPEIFKNNGNYIYFTFRLDSASYYYKKLVGEIKDVWFTCLPDIYSYHYDNKTIIYSVYVWYVSKNTTLFHTLTCLLICSRFRVLYTGIKSAKPFPEIV